MSLTQAAVRSIVMRASCGQAWEAVIPLNKGSSFDWAREISSHTTIPTTWATAAIKGMVAIAKRVVVTKMREA